MSLVRVDVDLRARESGKLNAKTCKLKFSKEICAICLCVVHVCASIRTSAGLSPRAIESLFV